jgi:hypothetical protein
MRKAIIGVMLSVLMQQTIVAEIKLVAVGHISKFEKTKLSFRLKSPTASQESPRPSGGGLANGRFPDATVAWPPKPESSGRYPAPDPSRMPPPQSDTTVFLTSATLCKEAEQVISCADLKTSDRVRVTGAEKNEDRGRGLYASEVVRLK